MHQDKNKTQHMSVLGNEVLAHLSPQQGESYLDVTTGYGGHATMILDRTQAPHRATLVDRDEQAVRYLEKLKSIKGATIIHSDYSSATVALHESGNTFDCILADLGVSSPHLDKASRGFSILQDAPLDMRMDQRQTLTAEIVLNTYGEEALSSILRTFGEEPKARQIARKIVAARPLRTTGQLAELVKTVWPHSRRHPATRTFQALRIEVNDELRQLREALPVWLNMLNPGGRIAIISFHSLEDRIVKQVFREYGGNRYDARIVVLTKKPITASQDEIVFNPRARSAKLRVAAKINNKNNHRKPDKGGFQKERG